MPALTIDVDLSAFDRTIDEIEEAVEAGARVAAQAGAQVIYGAVQRNVATIRKHSGNLASAIYQAFSEDNSSPGKATYHVSWNARKAPHGHLLEFGYLQRYAYYQDDQGNIRPQVRPGMQDQPKPKTRAAKDAYYVTLPSPRQVGARPFIRPALAQAGEAQRAAQDALLDYVTERTGR